MKTDITLLLDRSGSMQSVREDTIGGVNAFVEGQAKIEGECRFTLIQFDDKDPHEVVYDGVDISHVKPLDGMTFVPRGMTPLRDAIGRTINSIGARIGRMSEGDRPEKVILVIQTDGLENRSKEFTAEAISSMIKLQTETYSWEFIFLGANQDAIATAGSLGISREKSLTYASNSAGVGSTYDMMTDKIGAVRCSASAGVTFDASDRKLQEDLGAVKTSTGNRKPEQASKK